MNRGANGYPQGRQAADAQVLPVPFFRPGAYCIPGVATTGASGSHALQVTRMFLEPWIIPTTTRIDRLAAEITVAGAAGKVGRIGVFRVDRYGRPYELVAGSDTGAFPVDPGVVPALQENIVDITLTPGFYVAGMGSDGTPTVRDFSVSLPGYPGIAGVAGAPFNYFQWVGITATASISAAIGTGDVTTGTSTAGYQPYVVRARIAA